MAPPKPSLRLAAMVVLTTSSGCTKGESVSTEWPQKQHFFFFWRVTYLTQRRHFEHVQTRAKQQIAELDRLLLELRGRLNAGHGGCGSGHDLGASRWGGSLTKAVGCFVAKDSVVCREKGRKGGEGRSGRRGMYMGGAQAARAAGCPSVLSNY